MMIDQPRRVTLDVIVPARIRFRIDKIVAYFLNTVIARSRVAE
jgi:hypothetical protein